MMLILTGCPDGEEPKSQGNKMQVKGIDKGAAKEFMDNYMRYVLRGDNVAQKSFYGEKIRNEITNVPTVTNPRPVGYKLEEGQNKQKNMEITAHIYSASAGSPYYSDDTYKYTIMAEKGKMLIDKIKKDKTIEIYEHNNVLYKREGDKVQGEPILTLDDMPLFTTPKSGGEQKFVVPKTEFGPCALSPDSKTTLISTSGDNHSFIASVKKKETEEAISMQGGKGSQGGGGGKAGQQQGGGGGEQQGGQQQQQGKENISLKPIDLYFNTRINSITFSPDGKMTAVEYIPASGLSRIKLYKGEEGEPVETDIDKHFRQDRFSISKIYFVSEDKLMFTVQPIATATPEEQTLRGDWTYDIKGNKVKQVK